MLISSEPHPLIPCAFRFPPVNAPFYCFYRLEQDFRAVRNVLGMGSAIFSSTLLWEEILAVFFYVMSKGLRLHFFRSLFLKCLIFIFGKPEPPLLKFKYLPKISTIKQNEVSHF